PDRIDGGLERGCGEAHLAQVQVVGHGVVSRRATHCIVASGRDAAGIVDYQHITVAARWSRRRLAPTQTRISGLSSVRYICALWSRTIRRPPGPAGASIALSSSRPSETRRPP